MRLLLWDCIYIDPQFLNYSRNTIGQGIWLCACGFQHSVSKFIVLYVIDENKKKKKIEAHSAILESVFHLDTLKKQDGFKIPNSLFLVCVP